MWSKKRKSHVFLDFQENEKKVFSNYEGGPKKVSHYQKSSLNRIKTRHYGYIFYQFRIQNEHKDIMSLY